MAIVESCRSCIILLFFCYVRHGWGAFIIFLITVTDENKVWVLLSLVSHFFSCLTFPGFTSLDHRVITVTGENTVCVLSSLVNLSWKTMYFSQWINKFVMYLVSVLLLLFRYLPREELVLISSEKRYRWEQSMGSVESCQSCLVLLLLLFFLLPAESWSSNGYRYRWGKRGKKLTWVPSQSSQSNQSRVIVCVAPSHLSHVCRLTVLITVSLPLQVKTHMSFVESYFLAILLVFCLFVFYIYFVSPSPILGHGSQVLIIEWLPLQVRISLCSPEPSRLWVVREVVPIKGENNCRV